MKFREIMRFRKNKAPKVDAPKNRNERRAAKFGRKVAGAALAAFLLAVPLVSRNAMAEGKWSMRQPASADEPAEVITGASKNQEKKSSQEKEEPPEKKATKKAPVAAVEEVNLDAVLKEIEQFSAELEAIEQGDAPKDKHSEEGKPLEEKDEESVVSHNFLFGPTNWEMGRYLETNLAPVSGIVGDRGDYKASKQGQRIDIGGNAIGNEAGHALFGTFRYLNLIRLDAGGAFFAAGPNVPIGRLMLSPELNIRYKKGDPAEGKVKMAYYGSAAFVGNLPSWVYSSHSAALGLTQAGGKNFKLRVAGIIGGALSYPAWDDIFVNFSTGLSMEFGQTVLIYGMPTCYFAADNPMMTAYIGYYEPKFQDVEFGVQVMMSKGFVGRAFADIGLVGNDYGIFNRYGIKLTKMFMIKDVVEADLWGVIGMTQWSPLLGGGMDPVILAGASFSIVEEGLRSTNSYRYSHLQDFDVKIIEAHIPDEDHRGPYGFGRSGDPYYDVPINEAKNRILDSRTFTQFSGTYENASTEELLTTARFLGAFMQQVAYANDAYDSMTTGNIFDPDIKRIANASHEDMFNYLQTYISWYQNHSPGEQLPESLKGGIAVCAGMHSLITDFLVSNGIDAITASVNTPNGPHMVTIARADGRNILIDYGDQISTDGELNHLYGAYGRHKGAPTFKSQIYGPNGEYMGTYNTSEERLLRGAMGIDNRNILLRDYLGVW